MIINSSAETPPFHQHQQLQSKKQITTNDNKFSSPASESKPRHKAGSHKTNKLIIPLNALGQFLHISSTCFDSFEVAFPVGQCSEILEHKLIQIQ